MNCASNEYFRAVDTKALKARVITPVFKEEKDGQARVLGMFAKQARGLMARFACENRITRADDLKAFNLGGYGFRQAASEGDIWVFTRTQPAKKAA